MTITRDLNRYTVLRSAPTSMIGSADIDQTDRSDLIDWIELHYAEDEFDSVIDGIEYCVLTEDRLQNCPDQTRYVGGTADGCWIIGYADINN